MRILKTLVLISLVGLMAACACRTKTVTPSVENIPVAQPGIELRDINYDFDSYELTQTAKRILESNANALARDPRARVQVEGHCDERGTQEYNMVLGMNRARAAAEYLRSLGVAPSRMTTISYGKELPLDPRKTEDAYARNRRVHFAIER